MRPRIVDSRASPPRSRRTSPAATSDGPTFPPCEQPPTWLSRYPTGRLPTCSATPSLDNIEHLFYCGRMPSQPPRLGAPLISPRVPPPARVVNLGVAPLILVDFSGPAGHRPVEPRCFLTQRSCARRPCPQFAGKGICAGIPPAHIPFPEILFPLSLWERGRREGRIRSVP